VGINHVIQEDAEVQILSWLAQANVIKSGDCPEK